MIFERLIAPRLHDSKNGQSLGGVLVACFRPFVAAARPLGDGSVTIR